ncbi:MAG: tetratricopeptide repeat protein, partial [Actinomycetota bacterium]|nr:tetratricopeptide repeat protein [Actinomycetota bacterium]
GIAHALQELAELARIEADSSFAEELYGESLVLLQAVGDHHCSAASLTGLGIVAHDRGDHEQALSRLTESIQLCDRLNHGIGTAWALQALATVLAARGQAGEAAVLLGIVHSLRRSADAPLSGADAAGLEDLIHAVRSSLGAARFQARWDQGGALDLHPATKIALEAAFHESAQVANE